LFLCVTYHHQQQPIYIVFLVQGKSTLTARELQQLAAKAGKRPAQAATALSAEELAKGAWERGLRPSIASSFVFTAGLGNR
jgi:hypothetical protein